MKKRLIFLILISTIFIGRAQENNFNFQIGTKVSISDNTKKGIPNVYVYNDGFKTSNKLRFQPISGQLSSKSDLLGRVFTIEEIIEGKFKYNRLIVLSDDKDKLFYDYRIGIENQLIVFEELPSESFEGHNLQTNEPAIIRQGDIGKFRPNYPDGVYLSIESFNLRSPQKATLIPVIRRGRQVTKLDTLPDICDFFYESSNDVVSRCFAVSFHGFLYFRSGAITNYLAKNDKNQTVKELNTFSRVLKGGKKFLYTEFNFAKVTYNNSWYYGIPYKRKGVVWNIKKQEFDIFKSCKNYNIFLNEQGSNHKVDCKREEFPNLDEVRTFIERVK